MNNTLCPLSELSEVIAKRRIEALRRREDISFLKSILSTVALLAVVLVLFSLFFGFRTVEGSDMFPSFCDGDLALCKRAGELKKNDIVFYEAEGATYCGRVVAKGGDRVFISESGAFFVNGTVQENEIIYPTFPRDLEEYSAVVPDGSVFILGDFRTQAKDSREFGPISHDNIDRKVIALIRHRRF